MGTERGLDDLQTRAMWLMRGRRAFPTRCPAGITRPFLKKTSDEVLTGGDLYRFYAQIRNLNVNAPSLTRIVCGLPAVYSFA